MDLVPVACWKLNDVRFKFGSSFVLPETKSEFLELAALIKDHPGAPLSVFGHADATNSDAFNKTLSGNRAACIYAVLIRDTALWDGLSRTAGEAEGWGPTAIETMLTAIQTPGEASNGPGRSTISEFQRRAGIRVDGIFGPETKKALFLAYMDFLCPFTLTKSNFLAQGADAKGKGDFQGCSEFNPVQVLSRSETARFAKPDQKSIRDAENSANRRVMVLLFRPGTIVPPNKWPCPRVSEGVAGCRKRFWSDGEARRTPGEARREFSKTQDTFACRFYHRLVVASPCEGIDGPHQFRYGLETGPNMPWLDALRLRIASEDGSHVREFTASEGVVTGAFRNFTFNEARPGLLYSGTVLHEELVMEVFGPVEIFRVQRPADPLNTLPPARSAKHQEGAPMTITVPPPPSDNEPIDFDVEESARGIGWFDVFSF